MLLKLFAQFILLGVFFASASAQQAKRDYAAPSQLGMTGLIYTPSAYLPEWGMLDFGYTHFHQKASLTFEAGESTERTFLTSLTFLPFMELSVKLTKPYNAPSELQYGIGDRSVSLRIQLMKEKKHLPAILIGVHDPFAVQAFFNTNYLVFTKKYDLKEVDLIGNLGYGFSIEETEGDYLQGMFGGVQLYWKDVNFLAEYDTDWFNIGLGYKIKKFLFLKAALVDGHYFTGSINLRFFVR